MVIFLNITEDTLGSFEIIEKSSSFSFRQNIIY